MKALGAALALACGPAFGQDPQHFTIRLTPQAARLVMEDPWHQDQVLKKLPSGDFEMEIKAVNEVEVIQRVLSMGSEAEVLAPESTRDSVRQIVAKLVAAYGANLPAPHGMARKPAAPR